MLCVFAALAVLPPAAAPAAAPRGGPDDPWTLCAHYAAEVERQEDLPPYLLSAIAKVESGRWLAADRSVRAWPWTVTANGKGQFYATMEEAVDAVRALRAKGQRNIDVGCMQVNLLHHPDAFADMRGALDPARNIAYAAGLLERLQSEARSWPKAVAYYHSRTQSLNGPYRRKVFRVWLDEWRRAGLMAPATTAVQAADAAGPSNVIEAVPEENAEAPQVTLANFTVEESEVEPGFGEVQLGAFRVAENARSVWLKVSQENPALLGDFQPRIDVVDRGESGEMHFLRVSPVMNVKLARRICNELRHRAVDCLVVEPPQHFALYQASGRFH